MDQKRIFIHTTNSSRAKLLDYALSFKGYVVSANREDADIIIIDFDQRSYLSNHEMDIPVIVIGGSCDEDEILSGIYLNYADYVLEPFEISELEMVIEKNLYRKTLKQLPSSLIDRIMNITSLYEI